MDVTNSGSSRTIQVLILGHVPLNAKQVVIAKPLHDRGSEAAQVLAEFGFETPE